MKLFASSLLTKPSLVQKQRMEGRVSSSSRRSFGMTVFGAP